MCLLLNHIARKSLNWRTPIEWLLGYTPDITVLLAFVFWEPVYYKEVEPSFANTPEKYGRFAGISAGVGHSMPFIIYAESGNLIHQSAVRSARHGGVCTNIHAEGLSPSIAPKVRFENLDGEKNYDLPETHATIKERIPEDTIRGASDKPTVLSPTPAPEVLVETVDDDEDVVSTVAIGTHQIDMFAMSNEREVTTDDQDDSRESSNNTLDDTPSHRPLDPDTEKIHSRIDAYIEAGGTLPTIEVTDLLGPTFISEPDETGEQM